MPIGYHLQFPISSDEYSAIKRAIGARREALYLEQKYDFVIGNYMAFEEGLLKIGVSEMVLNVHDPTEYNQVRGLMNRLIMNLFTTGRTYEDSVPQHLNRIFDRDEAILLKSKAEFSRQYDSRLGYRAACKLRNFVQHQGFPVSGSIYSENWVHHDGEQLARYTVDPYLSLADLKRGDFNKAVLQELAEAGEKVDLKWLIREYVEGLSLAHLEVRGLISPRIDDAEILLGETLDKVGAVIPQLKGKSLIAVDHAEFSNERSDFYHDALFIPTSNIVYKNLLRKNRPLYNLGARYISSQILARD